MKRILAAILVSVAAFALTACGCDHKEVVDAAVPATCTETGLTEGKHCSVCDEVIVAQKTIPAIGHAEEVLEGTPATCTEDGLTDEKRCTRCKEVLVAQEPIPATGHTEEVIEAVPATCTEAGKTEGKKCADCGEIIEEATDVAALGHTTVAGTCDRCNQKFGIFEVGYYVDEFDQPTNEGYVSNTTLIGGTFSNSATTDSQLLVKVLVDSENITFFLYEYGRSQVKNNSSRYVDEYKITMKTADGTKHSMTGTVYCGGDRLHIDQRYEEKVLEALKSGENVSFYIVESEYTTTTYLFTVPTSDFAEEYAKLFG